MLFIAVQRLGNTADSSSLPFFFRFQVVLVLGGVKTQSNNEESLSLMILSHKKDAVSVGCPPAGRIVLTAQDHLATKSPGKQGCGSSHRGTLWLAAIDTR